MYKDSNNQRVKAWDSTVRRAQFLNQQQFGRRRRGFLFSPMSVAPDDDESSDPNTTSTSTSTNTPESSSSSSSDLIGDLYYAERLLPNGDFYTGQWSSAGIPHGIGKYLWTDGCMYEGEWQRGVTTGQGKFSWPSGSTYEGEFKAGFMDGYGTYTGSLGDTYKGDWSMNHRHGYGTKSYSNGDYYDGEWRSGLPDGHGRYIWTNGNEYSGQWQDGVINGKGSFTWAGGNRFDGGWEDSRPVGSGRFRWADGSLYIGLWNKDSEEEQEGLYYPSLTAAASSQRNPKEFFLTALRECKISPSETVSILPSQKLLNFSDGKLPPPAWRRVSADSAAAERQKRANGRKHTVIGINGNGKIWDSDEGGEEGGGEGRRSSSSSSSKNQLPVTLSPKPARKQGVTISKWHKNYELMLNLQLGIRHAVGRQPGQPTTLDLKSSAFDPKEKVWTKFPPEGTKHTPPHQSCDFRWKDYCPLVFRTLRKLFKVDAADYMISICGNDALRELSSPGKSGSFFYLTNDDRYMIKTIKKSEAKVLIRMLPAYYNHVRSFEDTLVTKIFGLHCVKLTGAAQKKVRFVIIGNLFCSEYAIHRRFDLKGSSHGRITDKPESEIDGTTTLKDLDLNFIFRLQKSWSREFRRQIERDCEFLEQERIMDYSLLVGVHFRDAAIDMGCRSPSILDSNLGVPERLGVNQQARVELTMRNDYETQLIGEPTGQCYDVILFFGIIDILQDYDISKKLEHAYKSIHLDPTSISAVDPKQYAKRFRDFIFRAFIEDT
ncbi:hypothetical protein KFK09_000842 [Dendrobium nobile]|uniref:Phosphatidylinositol 4-phosphate 5-kinase n=1 Tax=Dendrobium nobile TaxID=94219 RepID=A0A8T3CF10_DENNO|nr:hypothetical protein KFK09_000842 [Dendrobium nobile]